VVLPLSTTAYSVTGSSVLGCSASNTAVATVTVYISPTITVNNGTICSGQSFTLVAGGAVSYIYSGGLATVSPSVTTSYSVTGTSAEGCISANTAVAILNVNVTPTLSAPAGAICNGQSFTINPSGAGTYSFSGGSAVVSPSISTSYSVTGASLQGCIASNTLLVPITVNPLPTISVSNGTVCSGKSYTITATGAANYSYQGGSAVVTPQSTSTYSITGTSSAGCVASNTATATVTVFSSPTIAVNSGTICSGESFTIVPTGAGNYVYSGGSAVVSPVGLTSYSVTGTSTLGCVSNTAISTVSVYVTPAIMVNSGSVCAGGIFTIQPAGASSFNISGGSATVSPLASSVYTVTGTSTAGCTSSPVLASVTVISLPLISVNSGSVCAGQVFTIVPSGAAGYSYTGGSATVTPVSNSSYTVTGYNSFGCQSSNVAVASVTVLPLPVIGIAGSTVLCAGSSETLVASGAGSYTWNTGALSYSLPISPSIPGTYTVTGADANGCVSSAVKNVTVNPLPALSIAGNSAICAGSAVSLQANGSVITFTWNTGSNASIISVTPAVSTVYTVSGTDLQACVNTATSLVYVNSLPIILAQASTTGICMGGSLTLTGGGGVTYTWSSGILNNTPFYPTVTSGYTVTGTGPNSCVNSATVVVQVNALPVLTVVPSTMDTLCAGETVSLSVSGANIYSWNTGDLTPVIVVTPGSTTVYTVTGTSSDGCQSSFAYTQNVNACVSLKEINYDPDDFRIFPNPTGGVVHFVLNGRNRTVEITNSLSQKVITMMLEEGETILNLYQLPKGVYQVAITDGVKRVFTRKLILTE
jgi:hypothetical protein